MKELSIEQKAKAYDKALEAACCIYNNMKEGGNFSGMEDLEVIFPELKESEDERIRKWIIGVLSTYEHDKDLRNAAVTWLEKQGEKKSAWSKEDENECNHILKILNLVAEEQETKGYNNLISSANWLKSIKDRIQSKPRKKNIEQNLAKKYGITGIGSKHAEGKLAEMLKKKIETENVDNTNKVEPKFHEGDYVVDIDCGKVLRISEVLSYGYFFENGDYSTFDNADKEYRMWNINDAKNGDVLCYKDEISLYKHDIKNCTKEETTFGGFVYHCCYDGKRFITDNLYSLTEQDKTDICLATKKQHNLLFTKMKEAGYEWDSVNKKLKEIVQSPIDNGNNDMSNLKVGAYVVRRNGKDFHDGRKFAKVIKINKTIDTPMYQVDCDSWLYEDEIRLWSTSDAKDGDILTSSDNKPFIFNGHYDEFTIGAYCGLDIDDEFVISKPESNWTNNYNIRPATTEQRQALFNEMNLLGWIWNPETKELNRLDKNNENNN